MFADLQYVDVHFVSPGILEGADRLFRDDISINYTLVNQPTFQASYDLVSTLTEEELNTVCGDSEVCRYDYKNTSSSDMGDAARDAEEDYEDTNESTKPGMYIQAIPMFTI